MASNVFSLIRARYNTLSASQKGIADYVLAHPREVMLGSLNEVAQACGVSETTIIRFLRKLDYSSYQVFKVDIAQETSKASSRPAVPVYQEVSYDDGADAVMEKVLQSTLRSISDSREIIEPDDIETVANMILKARKVLAVGVGASASIANDFYHKMLKLGLNVIVCSDPHLMNIIAMNLTSKDLLMAFSHSGESREILSVVGLAKEQACPIASVTSYPKSRLAAASDRAILSSSQETQMRSDAMTSRIIQLMIIDMLHILMVVKLGHKAEISVSKSRRAVAINKQ